MNERNHQLIAYLATLGALLFVFVSALAGAALAPGIIGKIESFGLGTITGGLIGLMRIPSQRSVTIDQPANEPVPVEEQPR